MSYVLTVYSTKAFKEYLLPAVNNADHELILQKDIFGLAEDLKLRMEIVDGEWYLHKNDSYELFYIKEQREYLGEAIHAGMILSATMQHGKQSVSIIIKETESSFVVYEKYILDSVREITIGKEKINTFSYDGMGLVSGEHARIIKKGDKYVVEDQSANGVFINSKRISGMYQLSYGDCVDVFGLRLVYLDRILAVNVQLAGVAVREAELQLYRPDYGLAEKRKDQGKSPKKMFRRSPRYIPKIETERIEIEAPPAPKELNIQPTLLAIGPSLTMALPMLMGCSLSIYSTRMNGGSAGAFMYTGLVTAVGSALVGTIWSVVNMRQAKKKNREEELKRFDAYSKYLINCANDVKTKYENNTNSMKQMYCDAESCCAYNMNSLELWNRNQRHEDFLTHRLGIGSIPFQVSVDIPKERFTLINDSLAEKPKMIRDNYRMLQDVPVCVDLYEHKLVGVIGGNKRLGCYPVLHALVSQIGATDCYTDVKMAFIYDETEGRSELNWGFAKWLPHVWSEDKKTRYVAGNKTEASDVLYEMTKILRARSEEKGSSYSNEKLIEKPYYILFLESPDMLEDELISKYIFDTNDNCGITTVMLVNSYEELPNECTYIVENTPEYKGMYSVEDGLDERIAIQFDSISGIQVERFARRLSSIEVNELETGGDIPNVLTFFDMYGVQRPEELDVIDRWRKNRTYESMKALVGQKAGGVDCYLDVHEKYHGPHGLVAGTTGSGKSETLQTYMLSLALNYSPDDIGFFVIDYKGGGMANLFDGLPHMIGQISNLSGNQVRRAMVSIKSENMRRQRIFNEHGVNNINLYTRLYKNNEATIPVPHMFIVIDEFAELKREEPDFMRELISVAQVGRSLGVHLILATQKPSGTVDDNIWSNSKFRLCLRVQDRQDSTDMLHKPDAAHITQAGRCYLQVGNDELYELFQSAWSGAVYDENAGSVQTDIAKMLSESGKAALVGSHAQIKQKENAKRVWIGQLIEILEQSASITNIDIAACASDNLLMDSLTAEFFVQANSKGIEYPESDYNYHRVQDLISIYGILIESGQFNGADHLMMTEGVIGYASEMGKKLPEMKEKTQLDAIVEYLAKVAKENGYVHNLQLWLPVLPTELYLEELSGYEAHAFKNGEWEETKKGFSLETIVGLYDDPVNQAQKPFTMDLAADGNHAIIGTVTSGKSTFLMTYLYSLVNRYTPDAVNLYILDYSSKMLGALEGLAHVGGVIFEDDDEKTGKFFNMLENILEERKHLFKGGSYSQYIQANGLKLPVIVIVIDNFAAFRNKTENRYEEFMLQLLKEGVGYGIYVVVTAAGFSLNEIPNRMAENFRTVVCLEMNDKFAYSDVLRTLHLEVLPEENVKGRGIAKIGDSILEFQTALCMQAEDDYKRGELIAGKCKVMNQAWKGKLAKAIPEIPDNPIWSEFCELEDVQKMLHDGDRLPIGYDEKTASVYGIDLASTYCYAISGKARTGKTNALRLIMVAAKMMEGIITVIDFDGSLEKTAQLAGAEYITNAKGILEFGSALTPDFKERNKMKKQYEKDGMPDKEIYLKMKSFKKRFIIISDLAEFVKVVHNPGEGVGNIAGFWENILDKGALHNVFCFAGFNQDDTAKATGLNVYNAFTKDKKGLHFGGNVAVQRLLDFEYVPYLERNKVQKTGVAMLPFHDEDKTTKVVVPLYRME